MNKNKIWKLMIILSITLIILTGCFQNDIKNNEIQNNQENSNQTDTTQTDTNKINTKQAESAQLNTNKTDSNQTEIKLEIEKQVENLVIKNITLNKKSNSKVELTADIKNNSKEFSESKIIEITAIDESGETIAVFSGLVSKLAAMEETKFVTQVLKDVTILKDLEISIVK